MTLKKFIVPILIIFALMIIIDRMATSNASWSRFSPEEQTDLQDERGDQGTQESSSVTYLCKEGILEADFGPDSMGLMLPDGQVLSLPQVRSGSGIRYEKDGLEFSGKGPQAIVTRNGKELFSDCVARDPF